MLFSRDRWQLFAAKSYKKTHCTLPAPNSRRTKLTTSSLAAKETDISPSGVGGEQTRARRSIGGEYWTYIQHVVKNTTPNTVIKLKLLCVCWTFNYTDLIMCQKLGLQVVRLPPKGQKIHFCMTHWHATGVFFVPILPTHISTCAAVVIFLNKLTKYWTKSLLIMIFDS